LNTVTDERYLTLPLLAKVTALEDDQTLQDNLNGPGVLTEYSIRAGVRGEIR
jgi:hypothetical protein